MDRSDITRVEPAILIDAILVLLEVALHDGGPAGLQAAGRFSITRQLSALVVHDPELDPEHGAAAPPITTISSSLMDEPVCSICSIIPSHTVGTPAECVTPSSSNRAHRRSGRLS